MNKGSVPTRPTQTGKENKPKNSAPSLKDVAPRVNMTGKVEPKDGKKPPRAESQSKAREVSAPKVNPVKKVPTPVPAPGKKEEQQAKKPLFSTSMKSSQQRKDTKPPQTTIPGASKKIAKVKTAPVIGKEAEVEDTKVLQTITQLHEDLDKPSDAPNHYNTILRRFCESIGITSDAPTPEEVTTIAVAQSTLVRSSPSFWLLLFNVLKSTSASPKLFCEQYNTALVLCKESQPIKDFYAANPTFFELPEGQMDIVEPGVPVVAVTNEEDEEMQDNLKQSEKKSALKRSPPQDLREVDDVVAPPEKRVLVEEGICASPLPNADPTPGKRNYSSIRRNRTSGMSPGDITLNPNGGSSFKYQVSQANQEIRDVFGVEKVMTPMRISQRHSPSTSKRVNDGDEREEISVRFVEEQEARTIFVANGNEENFTAADKEASEMRSAIHERIVNRQPTPYSKSTKRGEGPEQDVSPNGKMTVEGESVEKMEELPPDGGRNTFTGDRDEPESTLRRLNEVFNQMV